MEEAEGGEKVGKGDGRLQLDICPRAPDLLVMPLASFTLKIVAVAV